MIQKKFLMMSTKKLQAILATVSDEGRVEIQALIEKKIIKFI